MTEQTPEKLVLRTIRQILSERRQSSFLALQRIFAVPGGKAAIREHISKVILGGDSRDLFLDIGNGHSHLFVDGGSERDQRLKLEIALNAKKDAASVEPKDDAMLQMIARVDLDLLCSPGETLRRELRAEAEKRVGTGPVEEQPEKKKRKKK